jgi:PPOX class probable F420-dependent enzyme
MPNRVESFFLRRDEVIGCIGPQFYSTEEKPESKTVAPHPRRAVYNAAAIQKSRRLFMSQVIPEKYRDLFQKRAFASLGTLMPDGRPQVTPVWCDFDGEHVIFNSAKGRQKDRNVRRDPRVSLAIIDPENPYRYLEIRGRVVEITEDGAAESIDKLAKKYLGVDKYPYGQPGEVRVLYKIKPEHATVMG